MEEIKKEILQTGYLENVSIGSYFHMKYRDLYDRIMSKTIALNNTYRINKTLRARVVFIFKYNCDLDLLKHHNKWLIFDRITDDFIAKSCEPTQKSWDKVKFLLNQNIELYDKNTTINILKKNNFYLSLFGKAKNRTLIKSDIKLYMSILKHTDELCNILTKKNAKFSVRIKYLVHYNGDNNLIICKNCKEKYVKFSYEKNDFNDLCTECKLVSDINYPSIGYFKFNDWKYHRDIAIENLKNLKVHTEEWFLKKYGDIVGKQKRIEYVNNRLESLKKQKGMKCSKISQELFWLIYEKLDEDKKKNVWFKDLNKEKYITDNNKHYYFPDFVLNNKIIEYDGKYWHTKEKDVIRNKFYNDNGYQILSINESDFRRGYKPETTIIKCLNYLNDENQ